MREALLGLPHTIRFCGAACKDAVWVQHTHKPACRQLQLTGQAPAMQR